MGAIKHFTASHNPPEYNGIKFFPRPMARPPCSTSPVASNPKSPPSTQPRDARRYLRQRPSQSRSRFHRSARSTYLTRLQEIVDLPSIQKAGLRVVVRSPLGRRLRIS